LDSLAFETFDPTANGLGGHFRLCSHLGRTQALCFEQYGAATHTKTMAFACPETGGKFPTFGIAQRQFLDFHLSRSFVRSKDNVIST